MPHTLYTDPKRELEILSRGDQSPISLHPLDIETQALYSSLPSNHGVLDPIMGSRVNGTQNMLEFTTSCRWSHWPENMITVVNAIVENEFGEKSF